MKKIEYIPIFLLHPHPDNPRKELGDLTDLAAAIKAKGVLQNMTVVPAEEGGYRIIIGHRRHAAAKLAGLTDLPCVVANMTPQEQFETMMVENIQRSDLTAYEQAEGFQLMLDMGSTAGDVAQKVGLSETTVRNRAKLTKLDKAKFKKAEARGATMTDFLKLNAIKDEAKRNKVLEFIGTADFNQKLKAALNEQEVAELVTAAVAELDASDWCRKKTADDTGHTRYYCCIDNWNRKPITRPDDAGEVEYVYTCNSATSLTVYIKNGQTEAPTDPETLRMQAYGKKFDSIYKQLDAISQQHYELRYEYVRDYTSLNSSEMVVTEFAARMMIASNAKADATRLGKMMGVPVKNANAYNAALDDAALNRALFHKPLYVLMCTAYVKADRPTETCFIHEWDGEIGKCIPKYRKNSSIDTIFKFLEQLGYELSDEEIQMWNGTHPLFREAQELVEAFKKGEPLNE